MQTEGGLLLCGPLFICVIRECNCHKYVYPQNTLYEKPDYIKPLSLDDNGRHVCGCQRVPPKF